ncbi:MAG: AsmA family protein [Caldimonas sp.]
MTARARRSRGRKIGIGFAVAVLVLVLAALATQPWWLGPLLGSYLSGTSGREVHFDSARVGLGRALAPELVLRGVRIANAPWADTRQPLAALEELVFRFAWRRFEDRWVITQVRLRDGEVNLARQADGLRNWRLRIPDDRGPGRFWFLSLAPQRATLRLDNEGLDLHLHTVASELAPGAEPAAGWPGSSAAASSAPRPAAAPSAAQPTAAAAGPFANRIDFDGAFRGLPFQGSVATGAELTFLETGRWFALRGHVAIDGARLALDGRAADLFRDLQVDAQARLAGKSLAALRPFLGDRHVEPRAFSVEGRVRIDAERYALGGARARIGGTDLAGELAWSRKSERRSVSADLRSDSADLADLLWLAGRRSPAGAKAAGVDTAARAASAAPAATRAGSAAAPTPDRGDPADRFAGAREIDADLADAARRFHASDVPALHSLKLKARLAEGALAVSDLDLGWAGGHSTGTIGLDLRRHPPAAEALLETRGVRIETLFPGRDAQHRITGALRGRLALKASGDDADALRASAAGTVSATLTAGTIPSLLDAQIGLQAGKVVRTMLSGNEAMALPCAALAVDVANGRAKIRSLVIASANTRTTGSGSIDLRETTIDLILTPEALRPGLLDLRKSIHLSGPMTRPARKLVDRVELPGDPACAAGKP